MSLAPATVVSRLVTHRTTVSATWPTALFLRTPEELRADLVAGGEQEQVEKDDLDERMDGNVELSDHHAGQQRPHDVAEGEGAEPHAPDQESERERQEDRQLGIVP